MIRILENTDISALNSFHVCQRAARIIEFDRAEDLPTLFQERVHGEWMAMGGANNILFTRDVECDLIIPRDTRIELLGEDSLCAHVRCGAGVEWDDFVAWSVERGLWGVENLSLIPGKVGAAPVQNIGAYGQEAKDTIFRVECFDVQSAKMVTLAKEHCSFSYRESIFKHMLKGRVIITAVEFMLQKTPQPKLCYGDLEQKVQQKGGPSLENIREAVCEIRRWKLPDTSVTGNCGSFFKNPVVDAAQAQTLLEKYPQMPHYPTAEQNKVKLAAGWLIEQAGLKGYTQGRVGVHPRQALVLINLGGATGSEVIEFAHMVEQRVNEKFGIQIDAEVNIY